MDFKEMKVGFALTGSFCTFTRILEVMRGMVDAGADIHPIFSKKSLKFSDVHPASLPKR